VTKMITSLKVAKVIHLAALKFAAAKSVVGVGVMVAASATGMAVTEQVVPDYIEAAVTLINQTIDAETGISTQARANESLLRTLAASQKQELSDAQGTITTGVASIRLKKMPVSTDAAEEVSVAQ
jgi:hypothetical protein